MGLLTQQENELIKTLALVLKMKNQKNIVDHFKSKYDDDPENLDHAFNYGVCMTIYTGLDSDNASKTKHQLAANRAFTKCLNQREDWWFARYLRSLVNQEISDGLVAMSSAFNADLYQKSDPDLDRQILIDQQNNHDHKLPYFFCPYISQTKSYLYKGLIDQALEIYHFGLQVTPITPVTYSNSFLTKPFYDVIVLFRKLEMVEPAEEIKNVALTLFPASKMLFMT